MTKICIVGSGFGGSVLLEELSRKNYQITLIDVNNFNSNQKKKLKIFFPKLFNFNDQKSYFFGFGGASNIWHGVITNLDRDELFNYKKFENLNFSAIINQYQKRAYNFLRLTNSSYYNNFNISLDLIKSKIFSSGHFKLKKFIIQKKSFNCRKIINDNIKNNFNLIDNAVVTKFIFDKLKKKIIAVEYFKNKKIYREYSDIFLLSAGAIETPRILMQTYKSAKVLKQSKLGKFVDDHPMGYIGKIIAKKNFFSFTNDLRINSQEDLRIGFIPKNSNHNNNLNSSLILRVIPNNNYLSYKNSLKKMFFNKKIYKSIFSFNIFLLIYEVLFKKQLIRGYKIHLLMNLKRKINNRIELSKITDNKYRHVPKLYFNLNKIELKQVYFFQNILKKIFSNNKKFYYKSFILKSIKFISAGHIAGGCSIGKKEEGYVVDNNLKVYGIKNLFICDNSIQKYTGSSNPTFTLIIFALRLSDFIKKLLSKKSFN
jgi:hypothetical protein